VRKPREYTDISECLRSHLGVEIDIDIGIGISIEDVCRTSAVDPYFDFDPDFDLSSPARSRLEGWVAFTV